MAPTLPECWSEVLAPAFSSTCYKQLRMFLDERYANNAIIYPKKQDIFRAFRSVKFNDVKVVILGQDPYDGPGQANGLAFAVNKGMPRPPTLRNIMSELEKDLVVKTGKQASLEGWIKQGILLLNSCLTVEEGLPNSHRGKGWEELIDFVIKALSDRREKLVFVLWGKTAQSKAKLIDPWKHAIIKSPHPSPQSAHTGFFGSRPFSQINEKLNMFGFESINWTKIDEFDKTEIDILSLITGDDDDAVFSGYKRGKPTFKPKPEVR